MRSEFKMVIAGFGAGAVMGILALTSVSASLSEPPLSRGDRIAMPVRAPIAYGDLDPAAVVSHVELIGPKGTVVEFRDPRGKIVFRSDPLSNTTVVARDAIIPSFTSREKPGDLAQLKLVNTAEPVTTGTARP